ncbi:MAG: LPXTG cell wall anchor domain-containing protein [Candidatus Sabulitectum sp.]|nr:LPXTG cell wall anchor domain-containing protein [Candidatus Sabulitectum sp.]
MLSFLLLLTSLSNAHPGIPVEAVYTVPSGYSCEELVSDALFSVLEADSGVFTIVPLTFSDSLPLPVLSAWNDIGDTLYLDPPQIVVTGWFPDSLMTPAFPPFPGYISIPPGLPEDYARNVSFWLVWGPPPGFPWLMLIGGVVLLTAVTLFILKRRKKESSLPAEPEVHIPSGKAAEKEALALLESEHYIHGHWAELYGEVDAQFRATVAGKFGVVNKALTLNQIASTLASTGKGRKFMEQASPIVRETTLQRYADWGSTRERAAKFIRKLAALRGEWSR